MIASLTHSLWHQKSSRRWLLFFSACILISIAFIIFQFSSQNLTSETTAENQGLNSATDAILRYQTLLQASPDNPNLYADLGLAYLQYVRETGDVSYYSLAQGTFEKALAADPNQHHALIGQGSLALARHDFKGALKWGEAAAAVNPYGPTPLAIMVDAYIELGRYEEAAITLQQLMDLRPSVAAYSRTSYLRELHGDVDGAIEAMRFAVEIGVPGTEETLWSQAQLGNLYFNQGDWETAAQVYNEALHAKPDYVYALAGLGRVQAAQGEVAAAIEIYEPLVERYPTVEFVATLGDLYLLNGQTAQAERQFELVHVIQQLNAAAGMDVDLELALFMADRGEDTSAVVAQAQNAYERRPSIYAADVLAWALYQNGEYEEAWNYSQEALRLNTQDALLHYHAGKIASALGQDDLAQSHLEKALQINPAFSFVYAADAEKLIGR